MTNATTDTNIPRAGKGLSSQRSKLELVDQTLFGTWCPWKRSSLVAYWSCCRDSWSEGGDRFGFWVEKCLESTKYMTNHPSFSNGNRPVCKWNLCPNTVSSNFAVTSSFSVKPKAAWVTPESACLATENDVPSRRVKFVFHLSSHGVVCQIVYICHLSLITSYW